MTNYPRNHSREQAWAFFCEHWPVLLAGLGIGTYIGYAVVRLLGVW